VKVALLYQEQVEKVVEEQVVVWIKYIIQVKNIRKYRQIKEKIE